MTNKQAAASLKEIKRDRAWLAAHSGYSIKTINNALAGQEAALGERMGKAFARAFADARNDDSAGMTFAQSVSVTVKFNE